ncbi:MAG: type II toxin-antitoxin system HicA family toxin [Candidatus Methanofastidiosia archaeon]
MKLLTKLGYEVVRQKGSHLRLKNLTEMGEHNITVPLHNEIAKGTLNDILAKVSLWKGISRKNLREMLEKL